MTYETTISDTKDGDGNRTHVVRIGKDESGVTLVHVPSPWTDKPAAPLVPRQPQAYTLPPELDPTDLRGMRDLLDVAVKLRDERKAVRDQAARNLDRCKAAHELAAANAAKLSGVHAAVAAHIAHAFKARPDAALPDDLPDALQSELDRSEAAKKERDKYAYAIPELQKELEAAEAALRPSHGIVDTYRLAVAHAEAIPMAEYLMELKTEMWKAEDALKGMSEIAMQLPLDAPRPPKPAVIQQALDLTRTTAAVKQPAGTLSGEQNAKVKWRDHFAALANDSEAVISF